MQNSRCPSFPFVDTLTCIHSPCHPLRIRSLSIFILFLDLAWHSIVPWTPLFTPPPLLSTLSLIRLGFLYVALFVGLSSDGLPRHQVPLLIFIVHYSSLYVADRAFGASHSFVSHLPSIPNSMIFPHSFSSLSASSVSVSVSLFSLQIFILNATISPVSLICTYRSSVVSPRMCKVLEQLLRLQRNFQSCYALPRGDTWMVVEMLGLMVYEGVGTDGYRWMQVFTV